MATAVPKGKSNVNFRLLLRNLEKAKHNPRKQGIALIELATGFLRNPEKSNEAGFKQTLASTVRWYEKHKKFLDRDYLGRPIELLNEVFLQFGCSSVVEGPSRTQDDYDLLDMVRALSNKNQDEEALILLKTMEEKVEKALEDEESWERDWLNVFFRVRGHCFTKLNQYHLAIEDYSKYLALMEKMCDNSDVSSKRQKIRKMFNFKEIKMEVEEIQRRKGRLCYNEGYYEEAKSDLKSFLKKPPIELDAYVLYDFDALCKSYLWLGRYKHTLHAAYLRRFYTKKLGSPALESWSATCLLAECLYKNKKFIEANWILSDLILVCQNNKIKISALELNGHCLMELNKYAEGMKNFSEGWDLSETCDDAHIQMKAMRIRYAMLKYASDAQDTVYGAKLEYLIRPLPIFFPIPLIEKGDGKIDSTSIKFAIEKSIQLVKPYKPEKVKNHLMFCNSYMITKMFEL